MYDAAAVHFVHLLFLPNASISSVQQMVSTNQRVTEEAKRKVYTRNFFTKSVIKFIFFWHETAYT